MAQHLHPEQQAREKIDAMLRAAGWEIQNADAVNLTPPGGRGPRSQNEAWSRSCRLPSLCQPQGCWGYRSQEGWGDPLGLFARVS